MEPNVFTDFLLASFAFETRAGPVASVDDEVPAISPDFFNEFQVQFFSNGNPRGLILFKSFIELWTVRNGTVVSECLRTLHSEESRTIPQPSETRSEGRRRSRNMYLK